MKALYQQRGGSFQISRFKQGKLSPRRRLCDIQTDLTCFEMAKCPHHVVMMMMIKTIIITTTMWCPVESTSSFSKPPVTHSSPGSALPVLISHPSFNRYLGCFQSLNRVNTICLRKKITLNSDLLDRSYSPTCSLVCFR